MNNINKLLILVPLLIITLFFFVSPASAAAPDGLGPWADTVLSFHQGVMKNGLPVPPLRSDPTSALGIAEGPQIGGTNIDGTFFALGFGGNIALGFDNGISNGALVIEATNTDIPYPIETAKVEMSGDGINWVLAGHVSDDGTVNKPEQLTCAKYVRITDTSIPSNYPDAVADGYDVDGVRATGDTCTTPTITPTLTPTATPSATPIPTAANTPTPTSGSNNNNNNNNQTNTNSNSNSNSNTNSNTPANPTSTPAPTAAIITARFTSPPCIRNPNPLIPCFPNTGSLIPGLPNTGLGPNNNIVSIILALASAAGISFLLIRKFNKVSSKK